MPFTVFINIILTYNTAFVLSCCNINLVLLSEVFKTIVFPNYSGIRGKRRDFIKCYAVCIGQL